MSARLEGPQGQVCPLATRSTVGRDVSAVVRVDHASVSTVHAQIAWNGARWVVRDLASVNGTWVNGESLESGKPRPLAVGDRLRFGAEPAGTWVLRQAGAPAPFAVSAESGVWVEAVDGVLVLPSESAPEATLYLDGDGQWSCDRGTSSKTVVEGAILALSEPWRVYLGDAGAATLPAATLPLDAITLVLAGSRDQEHVHARLRFGGRELDLGQARHWTVIHALAADLSADRDAPPDDRGWVALEVLSDETGIELKQIDSYISRARAHLVRVGVGDGKRLVDGARPGYRRLALAPTQLLITGPRPAR
jgi:hypothetical protein